MDANPAHADYIDPKRLDLAEPHSRRIAMELARGNYHAAHRLVDSAQTDLERRVGSGADTPLAEILETGTATALEASFRAVYVRDLRKVDLRRLAATPQIGQGRVAEIAQALLAILLDG